MPKLRKMLGKIDAPECIGLMRLIETQSSATLGKWAVSCAKENYLPIFESAQAKGSEMNTEDGCIRCLSQTILACEKYLVGEMKLAEVKPLLKEARQLAAEVKGEVAQAAARAIATACATVQTSTNALGYLFYGAAAVAYSEAGLEAATEVYDALATKELERALESLRGVAIENEPNPAKINWNC